MPIQFPAVIELSALKGKNGFKINGFDSGYSGCSVSSLGDINDDGMTDLLIGAYKADQSYVLFGDRSIGATGAVELSMLNGNNGFTLDGVASGSQSGFSVSDLGDINGDGMVDLIIGAPAALAGSGQSYVVFGGASVGASGTIELFSLNGVDGFKLNGIGMFDECGFSVSKLGDFNKDGFDDLLIGAVGARPNGVGSGQSYVIFGGFRVGDTGTIKLSSLNGVNGFAIDGITAGDYSGHSVSNIGDVNDDGIVDLIIGAPGAGPNGSKSGQSYVVFGGQCVSGTGVFHLADLDGANGFVINGMAAGDHSGFSVSNLGDINDDGINDLIIGAPNAGPNGSNSGQCYVVFGGSCVGVTGTLELSSLNGSNGFKINGISAGYQSGNSVAAAGDIDSDGVADMIIGALIADPNGIDSGESYVVFGGASIGAGGVLELSSLNGVTGFRLNGVAADDFSGNSVSTAGDVNGDSINDLIIGARNADPNGPASGQSYVVFGDFVKLTKNNLALYQNKSIVFNEDNLNATSINYSPENLQFNITAIQHGHFVNTSNPNVDVSYFSQLDIINNQIEFVQDGTIHAPSYKVSVFTKGRWASTVPEQAVIDFTPCIMTVEKNELSLTQGQAVILSQENLFVNATYCSQSDLQLIISDIQHGQFEYIAYPNEAITELYQQNVTDGQVQFAQDWSIYPPAYKISAFTGASIITQPESATIKFGSLLLINNALRINQAGTQLLNSADLYAKDKNVSSTKITFTVKALQYGQFESISAPGVPINRFTQEQINTNKIKFVQDGTPNVPHYNVIVSDNAYTLPPSSSNITFHYTPVLNINVLSIEQGQTVVYNEDNLKATDKYIPDAELIFSISALKHGYFSLITEKSVPITEFTQKQVDDIAVQFTQDGNAIAPSYNVSVRANNLVSVPQAAFINWTPKSPAGSRSLANNSVLRNSLIGTLVTTGVLGSLFLSYVTMGFLKNRRLNATADDKEGEQKLFYQEIIIPIAKAVFKQIKVTGFMNYISESRMEAYVSEIATVVNAINQLGIDIEIQHMNPEQSTELLTHIVKQMKQHLKLETSRCNRAWFSSFFKPQVTPEQIGEKAQAIAQSVHDALLGENKVGIINLPANVDLTDVIGQTPAEGDFTTGYVQMP